MLPDRHRLAYQLAYLLVGEAKGALAALQEAIRLAPNLTDDGAPFWEGLPRAALRQARDLPPERFFLRSLSQPEGALRQVDSLPVQERTALILDASALLTPDQIAAVLQLTTADLKRLLERTWAKIGLERSQLWTQLVATVQPIPLELVAQVESNHSAAEPPITPHRRVPRWAPIPGLLVAVALVLFVATRWQASQGSAIETASPPPAVTEPTPTAPPRTETRSSPPPLTAPGPSSARPVPTISRPPLDLSEFKPTEVAQLSEADRSLPDRNVDLVAEKLFQWMGEATVMGLAPQSYLDPSQSSLVLFFADDRVLWVQVSLECFRNAEECDVVVGGDGRTPIVLRQTDLSRWMAARAWYADLLAETPIPNLSPSGERRLQETEVLGMASIDKSSPGYLLDGIWANDSLLQTKEDGRWRTIRHPTWQVQFRHKEQRQLGEILEYDDLTGELINRSQFQFGT